MAGADRLEVDLLGRPRRRIWSAYSADRIEAKSIPMFAMNVALGALSTNFTVCSSTFSIALSSSWKAVEVKYSYVPPDTPWYGWSAFHCARS